MPAGRKQSSAQRPELVGRYEELYARGAYAPRAERERLSGLLARE